MIRLIYTRLLAALMLVVAFTSCSDDMLIQSGTAPSGDNAFWAQYDFVLADDDDATTRVAYESANTSVFEEGDEIGVYAVDDKGNLVDKEPNSNVRYEVRRVTNLTNNETRQVLIPVDPNVRVKKNNSYRYVLYYPYNPNMTLTRLKSYTHTVAQDQGAEGAYEVSDLLWAYYTPEEGELYTIEFDHAMAQIVIELGGIYVPTGNRESAVKLLNMPTQATGINLVQPLEEKFTYTAVFSSGTEDEDRMISTWLFEAGSTEDRLQYRACVPAHTIKVNGETPIVRVYFNSTDYKDYKINSDLELKPGYKYTFTLSKGGVTEIDITDDDSWVLDVLDPETGKPVGLLCREYLRYQPTDDKDEQTGTDGTNSDETPTKWINSQAWVFYNLKPNSDIPDLNTGKILRFIYDVDETFSNEGGVTSWPYPHKNVMYRGIFTPKHGYKWCTQEESYNLEYGRESETYGEHQYYMHGGKIHWDGTNNKISKFELPNENITNETALKWGHIAINKNNESDVDVSYSNMDGDNYKVGVVVPHYLVDERKIGTGEIETNKYPLVKIGYNQFWMSKPLRTEYMTDGTPLKAYNKEDGPGVTFRMGQDITNSDNLTAGYLYPFEKGVSAYLNDPNIKKDYDPANKEEQMHPKGVSFVPAPMYNKPAIDSKGFIPDSDNPDCYYYDMANKEDLEKMVDYFGPWFGAKICTRELAEHVDVQSYAYSRYEAMCKGETWENSAHSYTANISGLNLRALGYFAPSTDANADFQWICGSATILLKSTSTDKVDYFSFPVYSPWGSDYSVDSNVWGNNSFTGLAYGTTQYFAEVRLVMKDRNQADNGGSTNSFSFSRATTRASGKSQQSRNVRVQLVP